VHNSSTGEWSALTETAHIVATAASSARLAITELHYNPSAAQGAMEYLEIMNISAQPVLIGGTKFTLGITFIFPDNLVLQPGGRAVITENTVAFGASFPSITPAGQYSGNLSNSGEALTWTDAANVVIKSFAFDDFAPWPLPPDGAGPSLVLIAPQSNPDPGLASSWRSSSVDGGTPGAAEPPMIDWLAANGIANTTGLGDKDGDGLADLLEYAIGTSPNAPSTHGMSVGSVVASGDTYMTLVVSRPAGITDVAYQAEASTGLTSWTNAILVGATSTTMTWRHPSPRAGDQRQFMRLKVIRLP
jgi:hypothetical protein